jgi:hypothetical protein
MGGKSGCTSNVGATKRVSYCPLIRKHENAFSPGCHHISVECEKSFTSIYSEFLLSITSQVLYCLEAMLWFNAVAMMAVDGSHIPFTRVREAVLS